MPLESIKHFPKVICLTLPSQDERQQQVSKELQKAGINNFEFFHGVTSDSKLVKQAYSEGKVKQYPNCFRCEKKDCGNTDCNNILLPVQVAVTLSFQAIMESIAKGQDPFVAICEDDIVFTKYASKILNSPDILEAIFQETDLRGTKPVLIRLGNSSLPPEFEDTEIPYPIKLNKNVVMSNTFFIVNIAFAKIVAKKLLNITHTADVIIHQDMMNLAKCYTLTPQLVFDRSWSLGSTESLIHPKQHHIDYLIKRYGKSSTKVLKAQKHLKQHRKKAISLKYGFIGQPQCGGAYVSNFLKKNGLDVNLKGIGSDGICAWQYVSYSENYPLLFDENAKSKFFVHIENLYLYVQHPYNAIPALMVENQENLISYEFRQKHILEQLGINLDDYSSPLEQAARSYIHWYQLALMQKPKAILQIENFLEDCKNYLSINNAVESEIKNTVTKTSINKNQINAHLDQKTISLLNTIITDLGYKVL